MYHLKFIPTFFSFFTKPNGSNLKPTDRNWVGAWWISYVIGSALVLVPVLPLLGFSREFPDTAEVTRKKREFTDTIGRDLTLLKHDLRSMAPAFMKLLKNKPFMLYNFSAAFELLTISGFSTFLPKYLETQFHVTSSKAALYVGFAILPGALFLFF